MVWTVAEGGLAHCPQCTEPLESVVVEGRERRRCPECGNRFFRNPTPIAATYVVDDDAALLIERGRGSDVGMWAPPSGHVEADESPRVAAARELEEETSVATDPANLHLVGSGFLEFDSGHTMVSFNFAVPRSQTTGEPVAGDDAADVRFWSREEIRTDPPTLQLRAAGVDGVLGAIDAFDD